MMKSIRTLVRQDREKYVIPRRVQDVIPIQKIWEDGIFLTGGRYAKTFRFTDLNYQVASEPDKEKMFRGYSALINSLDCGATTKITIFNHKMSQINFFQPCRVVRLLCQLVCRPMRLSGQRSLPQILRLRLRNAMVPTAWPLGGWLRRACAGDAHFLRLGHPGRCAGPCWDRGEGGKRNGLYCRRKFQGYV